MAAKGNRILLWSSSGAAEATVRNALPDHAVRTCATVEAAISGLDDHSCALVLLDVDSGSSGAPRLLAHAGSAGIPCVVLTEEGRATLVLRWMKLGAADVLSSSAVGPVLSGGAHPLPSHLADRLLGWARRTALSGHFRILSGTPLEGVAEIEAGILGSARFCWLQGLDALEQILEFDDVEFRREWPPVRLERPTFQYAPRVLVVEDDLTSRQLLVRVLEWQGYRVFEAADGLEGYALAQRERLDAVVCDLELPKLDGWGLMGALRDDPATRELPVVLLSAHGDAVLTLKAARAGARAYLRKTGHARELLDALELLTSARRRVWVALESRAEIEVELPRLGASWLLEVLGELDVRGRLELEDELGRYEVSLCRGRLLAVSAQSGSLRVEGRVALEAVVTSRAKGRFVFEDLKPSTEAPWLHDALAQVQLGLSIGTSSRAMELASSPRRLHIVAELERLYSRVATARELRVLDALRQQPGTMDVLASTAELSPGDAARILRELLRRGVVVGRGPVA